jgi:hypothetical protein
LASSEISLGYAKGISEGKPIAQILFSLASMTNCPIGLSSIEKNILQNTNKYPMHLLQRNEYPKLKSKFYIC